MKISSLPFRITKAHFCSIEGELVNLARHMFKEIRGSNLGAYSAIPYSMLGTISMLECSPRFYLFQLFLFMVRLRLTEVSADVRWRRMRRHRACLYEYQIGLFLLGLIGLARSLRVWWSLSHPDCDWLACSLLKNLLSAFAPLNRPIYVPVNERH